MKRGGGKQKGADFERHVCRRLSLWVTQGVRDDVFWRAAMSGGRATNRFKRGNVTGHQAGDISSVHQAGNQFAEEWFVECKHVKDLRVQSFVLGTGGALTTFWETAKREARKYNKPPMIIAKQNQYPIIVLVPEGRAAETWASRAWLATIGDAAILDFEKMVKLPKRKRVRL